MFGEQLALDVAPAQLRELFEASYADDLARNLPQ